jgi:hypothetical protein
MGCEPFQRHGFFVGFVAAVSVVERDALEELAGVFHFVFVIECDGLAKGHEQIVRRIADRNGPQ